MSAQKKILFVITKSNFGGAQRYVYDLATSLPREQFNVAVACGGNGTLVAMLHEKNITVFEIKSFQRDISLAKEFSSLFELWKLYRTFRPDIVHLNSSKAGGMGAFVARCARIPKIIFTAHGWPFWEPRNIIQKTLIAFFSWLTVVFSHITICISESDARIGRRMPFLQNKIRMIRNGIAPYELLSREDARTRLFDSEIVAAHKDDVWVLTNAELTKNKNLRAGIDAVLLHNASSSKKIFYTLMGDGELRETLARSITEKGATPEVSMLGFVPDGRTFYKAFDIFLLPSLKEGVPYVLLEAGISTLPCIATRTGGIPEIIENGKNGFTEAPFDTLGLSHALTQYVEDANLRTEHANAHREKILNEYSSEQMIRETRALYT